MIPFADLPRTFLGAPVKWDRQTGTMGRFQSMFMLGALPAAVVVNSTVEPPAARVTVMSRPGVALFVVEGRGSLAQIETVARGYLIDVATKLSEVALRLATSPEASPAGSVGEAGN